MSVPQTVVEKLLAALPANVKVGNDTIPIFRDTGPSLKKGIENKTSPQKYPALIVEFVADRESAVSPMNGLYAVNVDDETQVSEAKTFATGTLDYLLNERDAVKDSETITGTAGGSPRTFVRGTDYDLVDTDANSGLDTVRWRAGGTKPDNGTQFTVTYKHYTPSQTLGEESEASLRLDIYVSQVLAGGTIAGNHEAEDVMAALVRDLKVWWKKTGREKLVGHAVLRERGPFQNLSYLEGRGVLREGFDFVLAFRVFEKFTTTTVLTATGDLELTKPDGAAASEAITLNLR